MRLSYRKQAPGKKPAIEPAVSQEDAATALLLERTIGEDIP